MHGEQKIRKLKKKNFQQYLIIFPPITFMSDKAGHFQRLPPTFRKLRYVLYATYYILHHIYYMRKFKVFQ